jgi:hypothetical protein
MGVVNMNIAGMGSTVVQEEHAQCNGMRTQVQVARLPCQQGRFTRHKQLVQAQTME